MSPPDVIQSIPPQIRNKRASTTAAAVIIPNPPPIALLSAQSPPVGIPLGANALNAPAGHDGGGVGIGVGVGALVGFGVGVGALVGIGVGVGALVGIGVGVGATHWLLTQVCGAVQFAVQGWFDTVTLVQIVLPL